MSDYDSSLPIRTEAAGDVDVFISDATTPTQKLKVNADGSVDTNFAAGAKIIITDGTEDLEINADGSINATVEATDLDIRDIDAAQDNIAISDGTNTLAVNADGSIDTNFAAGSEIKITDGTETLEINADGSINATVTAADLDIRDLAFATDTVDVSGSSVTVTATDLDTRDLTFATDSVDVSGSSVSATVTATDLDIRDLVAATDSVSAHLKDETGTAYSASNPLSVVAVSDQAGDEICDFNTSSAVAKDASVNHDYTVTAAKTFLSEQAWISGSGKLKAEVLINGAVVFVGFNSTSNPNIEIPMGKICKAGATEVVRITITNRDKQPQDVYSTLTGLEV